MILLSAMLLVAAQDIRKPPPVGLARLSTACTGRDCPAPRSRYRITGETETVPSAKDRALGSGAPTCGVTSRVCTRKPRTVFRTDFTN